MRRRAGILAGLGLLLGVLAGGRAEATTAAPLPAGGRVVYAGLGLGGFSARDELDGSGRRVSVPTDPVYAARADLYAAAGLRGGWGIEASLPLVAISAVDRADTLPCGSLSIPDYCAPVWTAGSAQVRLRRAVLRAPVVAAPFLGLAADPWNRATRGRFTTAGDGTVDLLPGLALGRDLEVRGVAVDAWAWGAYAWRFGWRVEDPSSGAFRAPGDEVRGGAGLRLHPAGRLAFEVAGEGMQRLWGVQWDDGYEARWFGTDDRWVVLRTAAVAVRGKLSLDLGPAMGLHLSAQRVVLSRNGAPGAFDVALGLHRYFAPGG